MHIKNISNVLYKVSLKNENLFHYFIFRMKNINVIRKKVCKPIFKNKTALKQSKKNLIRHKLQVWFSKDLF